MSSTCDGSATHIISVHSTCLKPKWSYWWVVLLLVGSFDKHSYIFTADERRTYVFSYLDPLVLPGDMYVSQIVMSAGIEVRNLRFRVRIKKMIFFSCISSEVFVLLTSSQLMTGFQDCIQRYNVRHEAKSECSD